LPVPVARERWGTGGVTQYQLTVDLRISPPTALHPLLLPRRPRAVYGSSKMRALSSALRGVGVILKSAREPETAGREGRD